MHIAIWQQFSSNHSGSFSVVGRFETEAAAREAAEKLDEIVRRIDAWHEDPINQAWYRQNARISHAPITPIEAQISQEYEVDWGDQAADWYGGMSEPIRQIGRDVFFNTAETWSSPTPIVNLLEKFGGQTAKHSAYEEEVIDSIYVLLTCTFENETVAQQTREAIAPFTQAAHQPVRPPWAGTEDRWYLYLGEGTVTSTGRDLALEYSFYALELGLQSMVQWLESRGAKQIDYRFETRHNPSPWD